MDTSVLQEKFEKMGARIDVRELVRNAGAGHRINVTGQKEERFVLDLGRSVKAQVIDLQPKQKHLLLLVKGAELKKYLCGHDERHWFTAGVPVEARSVEHAKELLQPEPVKRALADKKVSNKRKFDRKNEAYVRQGEWFFVPQPDLYVKQLLVLNHEPIRRGASKPHMVEYVYRKGGTRVHICTHYPNGLTESQFLASFDKPQEGFQSSRSTSRWLRQDHDDRCKRNARVMVRDAQVYAKGRVSHPDHATIVLKGWHRVHLSNEVVDRQFMAFLD